MSCICIADAARDLLERHRLDIAALCKNGLDRITSETEWGKKKFVELTHRKIIASMLRAHWKSHEQVLLGQVMIRHLDCDQEVEERWWSRCSAIAVPVPLHTVFITQTNLNHRGPPKPKK